MNFPPFWARGKAGDFIAWRWSFQSIDEAQALATQAAHQLADRFRSGGGPSLNRGYYPDRPFREQVLREFRNSAGQLSAVVTRNSYGCQVLNTARIMFVDIDLPESPPADGFFKRLFGKPAPSPRAKPENDALYTIENWTRRNPQWGWRIYRTRAGLRLLATQGIVEAGSESADRVFDALGADPLYRKLCQTQKCFRARLTPKHWRCGVQTKPDRWPWLSAKHERSFQQWDARYQRHAAEWATCELIRPIGNPDVHPEVEALRKLHDETTRAESRLPLA